MTAAAICASLVDVRNIAQHKCVRLTVEVPAELAMQVIECFGWPTMTDPVPIAVARLETAGNSAPAREAGAAEDRTPLAVSASRPRSLAQQAGMCCADPRFWQFLREQHKFYGNNEHDCVEWVRAHCIVNSRADIKPNTPAARLWRELHEEYQAWLISDQVVSADAHD